MRKWVVKRLLVFIAVAGFAAPVWAASGERGILLREAQLRVSPDANSALVATAQRGREVLLVEKSQQWVKVFAYIYVDPDKEEENPSEESLSQPTGWMVNKGIVLASTPNGDRIVFGEAADSEEQASRRLGRKGAAQDAMRLYARMAEYFPKSPLAGEALYRSADIRWQIDYADVMTRPSAHEQDPDLRGKIEESYMREVIKKFPRSKWADMAAYNLLDNKLCGDWQGQSKCPQRESELYDKYAREHPQSPKAPEALYNAAWRQAALIEIYKSEDQAGHSADARKQALNLAQRLTSQYPDSEWVNRAAWLEFLMQQNVPTYGNAIE
jgi:hypothetical protein